MISSGTWLPSYMAMTSSSLTGWRPLQAEHDNNVFTMSVRAHQNWFENGFPPVDGPQLDVVKGVYFHQQRLTIEDRKPQQRIFRPSCYNDTVVTVAQYYWLPLDYSKEIRSDKICLPSARHSEAL